MSSVRVVFVELDGTPEMVQQVISQFVDRAQARPLIPAAPLPVVDPPQLPAAPALPLTLRSPELVEQPPAKRRSPAKRTAFRFRPGSKPSAPVAEVVSSKASPAQDAVRAILAKGPMTSGDLLTALQPDIKAGRIAVDSIYATLSVMRKKGVIETREDEANGLRKNYLVE